MIFPLIFTILVTGTTAPAVIDDGNFVFCRATSIKTRARGMIVSPIFDGRTSNTAWLRQSFMGFLRASYASYGNNWQFSDNTAECVTYSERQDAQVARNALILAEQRQGSNIFYVTFVG